LIVSPDETAIDQTSEVLRKYGLSIEVSHSISLALNRIRRRKFEAVIVDFQPEAEALRLLEQMRTGTSSNRTAVTFAITGGEHPTTKALKSGFTFVLEKPLTPDSIAHTLMAAYGSIMRQRRRYFRYPITVPVVLGRKQAGEFYGRSLNISENGIAVTTASPLAVGDNVTVQFTLQSPPLQVTAESKVCWNNNKSEAGLSFVSLPFNVASELHAWLAQKLEVFVRRH